MQRLCVACEKSAGELEYGVLQKLVRIICIFAGHVKLPQKHFCATLNTFIYLTVTCSSITRTPNALLYFHCTVGARTRHSVTLYVCCLSSLLIFLLRFNNGSHVCMSIHIPFHTEVGLTVKVHRMIYWVSFWRFVTKCLCVMFYLFSLKKHSVSKAGPCIPPLMTEAVSPSETLCFWTKTRQWKIPIKHVSLDSCRSFALALDACIFDRLDIIWTS